LQQAHNLRLLSAPLPAMPAPPAVTRFILIEPSHAGNVGAVARAMKVMGFHDLALVRPRWPDVLTRPEAVERASGADDVLRAARVTGTLQEALEGVTHLCATAMTPRDFGPPVCAPREHFSQLLNPARPAPSGPWGVAFLFGCERYGMRNADVWRCHACLSIPANPAYGSLNLAAAAQLIAYDWRQALLARFGEAAFASAFAVRPAASLADQADAEQVAAMLAHLEQALVAVGFLDPAAPKKLMPRLQQLFNRAQPTQQDIHILRGIARAMQQAAKRGHEED